MAKRQETILLVDDDSSHRTMLKVNLESAGFPTLEAQDGDEVLPILAEKEVDLILLDLKMKRMGGLSTLSMLLQSGIKIPVVVITAFSSVESAVEAMKKGAFDYITKPVDIEELKLTISRALNFRTLDEENRSLKKKLGERYQFDNIIGKSPAMQEMFATLKLVAPTDSTVLITGESGTGKELIADALHQNSARSNAAFVKLNCAALHENLLESELFGHEAGSFTGASSQRKGRFELADKGTLFLDEIGDMSLATQAKILRILQEGEFERVGGNRTIKVDVRLLAATHKDLQVMISEGTFRQDLFFRLSVIPLHLPALRERNIDIPELAQFFLKRYAVKNRKDIKGFHPEALNLLMQYDWPGNIRELENTIERATILCLGEQITPRELPPQFFPEGVQPQAAESSVKADFTLRDMEREVIKTTLEKTGNNKSATAKKLGIARQTLLNKLKEYGIE
ncbi:sigma-54-dependent transcriptional regulator [Desulfopila inferna]|uniref:sigma-54-dependent transcriptional regulator n=1 Tax=Desulfopila inferna TaxID=468528 RepID=UPI0019655B25|nr:sigma-54 dependent transcriptional regulator [Desulfopila inferna]MBM9603807.1 sigma-54-dependent Fis family transcriptional regulator [Desulfopila inferna]